MVTTIISVQVYQKKTYLYVQERHFYVLIVWINEKNEDILI